MNIFLRELKANMKSLIIWSLAQIFVIFSGMVKYEGYATSGVSMNELFKDLPKGFQAILGIGEIDISKIEGYYSLFFLFFILLATIHAGMLGAVIVNKEERDHSADFLFSRPVSRRKIITAKLLAGLFNVFVFNMVTLFSSLYFISIYNKGNPLTKMVLYLMTALFIVQVFFLFLGSAIGSIMKTAKKATSITTAILLGAFFLSLGIGIDSRIEFLKFLTPFQYFDAKQLVFGKGLEPGYIILSVALTAVFLFVTYTGFEKRDLAT